MSGIRAHPSIPRTRSLCLSSDAPDTAEMDARRLRWKNAKALRLAIEPLERVASAKARRHIEEREHFLRRFAGGHMELSDDGSSSDNDDNDPPAADAYTEGQSNTAERKGKAAARKW